MGSRRFSERTKTYLEFSPSASYRPRKPTLSRLVLVLLFVIIVGLGLRALGVPGALFLTWSLSLVAVVTAVYRRWRPLPAEDPRGWYLDSTGEWRWWDGSAWTDGPKADAGESSPQAGTSYPPQIEW